MKIEPMSFDLRYLWLCAVEEATPDTYIRLRQATDDALGLS